MIILWLLRIKSVLSTLLTLIIEHWREFSIFAICMYALLNKTHYDSEKHAFEAYKAEIAQQAKEQQIKNDILRKHAEKQVQDLTEIHTSNLEAIRYEYEKTHNTDVSTIDDLRKRLLNELRDSYTVPEGSSDTTRDTKSERECNAAYFTLEAACKITTSDFNAIRSWADTVCETVGCE
jgi:hypothetical protein